jgi:hypothetical protein
MIIAVNINERPIEIITVTRRENLHDPDALYVYDVHRKGEPQDPISDRTVVVHKYSDGALVLMQKAVEALISAKGR